MATTINPVTGVIFVPKADTTLIDIGPPEIRELDTNEWRLELRDIEDNEGIRWATKTHNHNADVNIGGGVVLADVFLILAPYTVTFEDGQYTVNLVGTNHNILLVNNKNQVSLASTNSAGLIVIAGGGGATAQEIWEYLITGAGGDNAEEVLLAAFKKARLAANKL